MQATKSRSRPNTVRYMARGAYALTAGDVNGDGKPDLITASESGKTVSVLMNSGNGTFQPKVNYTTGTSPSDTRGGCVTPA